jgi:hypothetical protein
MNLKHGNIAGYRPGGQTVNQNQQMVNWGLNCLREVVISDRPYKQAENQTDKAFIILEMPTDRVDGIHSRGLYL